MSDKCVACGKNETWSDDRCFECEEHGCQNDLRCPRCGNTWMPESEDCGEWKWADDAENTGNCSECEYEFKVTMSIITTLISPPMLPMDEQVRGSDG